MFIIYKSMGARHGEGCHDVNRYVGLVLMLTILSCNLCYWFHSTSVSDLATYHVAGGWCQYVSSEIAVDSEGEDIAPGSSSPMDKLL